MFNQWIRTTTVSAFCCSLRCDSFSEYPEPMQSFTLHSEVDMNGDPRKVFPRSCLFRALNGSIAHCPDAMCQRNASTIENQLRIPPGRTYLWLHHPFSSLVGLHCMLSRHLPLCLLPSFPQDCPEQMHIHKQIKIGCPCAASTVPKIYIMPMIVLENSGLRTSLRDSWVENLENSRNFYLLLRSGNR